MDDERLERVENMLTELISMVGKNNSILQELGAKVGSLEAKVGSLEAKVGSLEAKVGSLESEMQSLKKNQELFRDELFNQSERIDQNHRMVMDRLEEVESKLDYSLKILQKHDIEIHKIKERMAV